jgi:transposase
LDVRVLRGWVERLAQLQGSRQQMLNRLEATSSELSALVKVCKADVRQLDKAIEQQERVIKQHTAKCEQLAAQAALLESIPGMGHVTATKVLAYGGDISRFASAGAFIGFSRPSSA